MATDLCPKNEREAVAAARQDMRVDGRDRFVFWTEVGPEVSDLPPNLPQSHLRVTQTSVFEVDPFAQAH